MDQRNGACDQERGMTEAEFKGIVHQTATGPLIEDYDKTRYWFGFGL